MKFQCDLRVKGNIETTRGEGVLRCRQDQMDKLNKTASGGCKAKVKGEEAGIPLSPAHLTELGHS